MKKIILILMLTLGVVPYLKKGKLQFIGTEKVYADDYGNENDDSNDPCDPSSSAYDPEICNGNQNNDDPCDPNSTAYNPAACNSGDQCDEDSPNYDETVCEQQTCNPQSVNYDVDECDEQVCDPNSVNTDNSECEIETCDPDNVNYNVDECDEQVCDQTSINSNDQNCDDETCLPDNINYDPTICAEWGNQGKYTANAPKSMPTQVGGATCVPSTIDELLNVLCNQNINVGTVELYYVQNYPGGGTLFTTGVDQSNILSYLKHYFTVGTFGGFTTSINSGNMVVTMMITGTDPSTGDIIGHNVLVEGYDPNDPNSIFYLDPMTGQVQVDDISRFSTGQNGIGYAYPITGCTGN